MKVIIHKMITLMKRMEMKKGKKMERRRIRLYV